MITPHFVRTSMIGLICGLLIGCFIASPVLALQDRGDMDTEERRKLTDLERTVDEMYQYVSNGEIEQAMLRVQLLTKQLTEIQLLQYTSVEGAEAFFSSLVELQRALAAVKQDQHASKTLAAKVRLAVDAIQSQGEPIWRQYYKTLKEDLKALEQAVRAEQNAAARQKHEQLFNHYMIVRPAILISLEPAQVAMFDSLLTAIEKSLSESAMEQTIQFIQQAHSALAELFDVDEDKTTFLPGTGPKDLLYWSTLLGSLIAVILAYVAWRKFRYDSGYVSVSGKDQREPFIKD